MSIYRELAQSTYNKIFVDGLHIPSDSIENLKLIIDQDTTLLSSKKELPLYIEALIQLIKVEKITVAENQKLKYGRVILNKYDEILELYNWLKTIDYTFSPKNNNPKTDSFNWLGDDQQLELLYASLIKKELIKKNTSLNVFKQLFSPDLNKQQIQWIHTTRLLDYFFNSLNNNSLIDCANYQAVIKNNKLFKNKSGKIVNANDLSAAKSNYKVGGVPVRL